jgi:hypothetical protein
MATILYLQTAPADLNSSPHKQSAEKRHPQPDVDVRRYTQPERPLRHRPNQKQNDRRVDRHDCAAAKQGEEAERPAPVRCGKKPHS